MWWVEDNFRRKGVAGWKSARCFPHTAPNSELEMLAHVSYYPAHSVYIWAREALPLSCALKRGRCQETFWPTAFHLHLRLASILVHYISLSSLQTSGLIRLKGMQRLWSIAFPVLAPTSGRDRVTLGTHLPEPPPPIRLCSIKSLCKSS